MNQGESSNFFSSQEILENRSQMYNQISQNVEQLNIEQRTNQTIGLSSISTQNGISQIQINQTQNEDLNVIQQLNQQLNDQRENFSEANFSQNISELHVQNLNNINQWNNEDEAEMLVRKQQQQINQNNLILKQQIKEDQKQKVLNENLKNQKEKDALDKSIENCNTTKQEYQKNIKNNKQRIMQINKEITSLWRKKGLAEIVLNRDQNVTNHNNHQYQYKDNVALKKQKKELIDELDKSRYSNKCKRLELQREEQKLSKLLDSQNQNNLNIIALSQTDSNNEIKSEELENKYQEILQQLEIEKKQQKLFEDNLQNEQNSEEKIKINKNINECMTKIEILNQIQLQSILKKQNEHKKNKKTIQDDLQTKKQLNNDINQLIIQQENQNFKLNEEILKQLFDEEQIQKKIDNLSDEIKQIDNFNEQKLEFDKIAYSLNFEEKILKELKDENDKFLKEIKAFDEQNNQNNEKKKNLEQKMKQAQEQFDKIAQPEIIILDV